MELKKIEMKYQKKLDQNNLFSSEHVRYEVMISCNEKTLVTEYQCNKRIEPTKEDVLGCLLSDTMAYDNCGGIDDFQKEFGFTKVSDCIKAYDGCKNSSKGMHTLFTEDELEELYYLVN